MNLMLTASCNDADDFKINGYENLKSEFSSVLALIPKPSDPNKSTFFPFQLFVVKSFVAETSKALTQKSLFFKYPLDVFRGSFSIFFRWRWKIFIRKHIHY